VAVNGVRPFTATHHQQECGEGISVKKAGVEYFTAIFRRLIQVPRGS